MDIFYSEHKVKITILNEINFNFGLLNLEFYQNFNL